jgi:hypothetical protein
MTIPHPGPQEPLAIAGDDMAETQEPSVTHNQASSAYGLGTSAVRERWEKLDQRYHLARAQAILKARGEYDEAKYGAATAEPLTTAEHLERLALGEYLSRAYKPSYEVDGTLRSGAAWAEVAAALGVDEEAARDGYRKWAEGQHHLYTCYDGKFGMGDAEYAEAMQRAGDPSPVARKAEARHEDLDLMAD